MSAQCCRLLLSEALDLCVRAKKLDEALSAAMAVGGVGELDRPMQGTGTRCLTPALWVQDQYDNDLSDWQARARSHLMQGCSS